MQTRLCLPFSCHFYWKWPRRLLAFCHDIWPGETKVAEEPRVPGSTTRMKTLGSLKTTLICECVGGWVAGGDAVEVAWKNFRFCSSLPHCLGTTCADSTGETVVELTQLETDPLSPFTFHSLPAHRQGWEVRVPFNTAAP